MDRYRHRVNRGLQATFVGAIIALSSLFLTISHAQEQEGGHYTEDGPWGRLRCFPIFLEAPIDMMNEIALPRPVPRWAFHQALEPQLPALFERVGLPVDFVTELLDPKNQSRYGSMLYLFPKVDRIEAMTSDMRQGLYPVLAQYADNAFHQTPITITTKTVDEWTATSKLRPDLLERFKKMTWIRNGCLAFGDVNVLIFHAQTHSEAQHIHKFCSRTLAIMAQLELTDETDVESVLDYWTLHSRPRRKSIEPIMRSVVELKGIKHLPISHILPPLARKLVYTYPDASFNQLNALPFCHWTALNFFNYEPDHALMDDRLATSAVLENFSKTDPPYDYGDIIFFADAEGLAFHSCVYLAAGMVYTKNGENKFAPWIIMTLENLKKIYITNPNQRIQGHRRKTSGH